MATKQRHSEPLAPVGDNEASKRLTTDAKESDEPATQKTGFFAKILLLFATILPPGSVAGSAFNLASTTIGAGIFGLPAAANSSGLVVAILYLLLVFGLSVFSIYILAVAADRSRVYSYEGVARALLGRCASRILAGIRVFLGFSGCVAYVISVHDIVGSITRNSNASDFVKGLSGSRLITLAIWFFIMLPLVIPRNIDTLRYVSTFAVLFMVYVVFLVVVHSCTHGLKENVKNVSVTRDENAAVVLFNDGNRAIEGLGVFVFAFICQVTAYEIYFDMVDRSVYKMTLSAIIGLGLCCILYILTCVFGYLDFGSGATGSILRLYNPIDQSEVMVGYVGVFLKLCSSYALLCMACRNALYCILGWDTVALKFWKHCIVVISIAVLSLTAGLFIPKINVVFGFAGSIAGGAVGFIFPSLFLMYAGGFTWGKISTIQYLGAYALLIIGVVVVVFGTTTTIWSAATG
ncbi:putative Transmembrane amino acid transporter protein putativeputative [Trypanosoma vivax]|uniref:Putative amino acid transporter n=1 Tax=Trypanosoma vivax (strain Y486) TaxID=1055687 RepID=G0U074_TRYVY|nr:putative amino acid transporter [Trypanosoma vivax]KAH8613547.1 putative Transmembrane amino acid transporter protein putativeputative [Trypanosoma vivax]CCC49472.1 putative amino acid transporter [Trypanosoma vivax Y486]